MRTGAVWGALTATPGSAYVLAPGADSTLAALKRGFSVSLWTILAAGVLVSCLVAALTPGDPFDMQSFRMVRDALDQGALSVYASFAHRGIVRWPYPPAFFPWIWIAGRIAALGGPGFGFMIRVPSILADAGIAWIVQDWLGRTGRDHRERLLAAALVSAGPSFIVIAGYHGQFDAVAILPGVLAVSLWSRADSPHRALTAGMLIGLGGALKTVPLLLVLALLPTARTRREAVLLLAAAALPVLVSLAPFAIAGSLPPAHVFSYHGLPGVGDLSLVAQPNLAQLALGIGNPGASPLTEWLIRHGTILVVAGLLIVAGVGLRSRAGAPQMATILWLAVYVLGINFFFQYLIWGLPFFVMAGYLRSVSAAQLTLIVPSLLFYLRPWHQAGLAVVYDVLMIGLWAIALVTFLILSWRLIGQRPRVAMVLR